MNEDPAGEPERGSPAEQVLPPPPLRDRPGLGLERGWTTALIHGGLAFVVIAALGQAMALAVYLVGKPVGVSAGTFARIGWLYFGWFHRVSITASLPNVDLGALIAGPSTAPLPPGSPGGSAVGSASLTFGVGVALLLATGAAAWLLYRAGRAAAEATGGGPLARVLGGLKVAPVYAVPSFVAALAVSIRLKVPLGSLASGELTLRSSRAEALLFPLLIAAGAGLAGGLASAREQLVRREPWGRRAFGALAGGWRMLTAGIALSFVGLLVLAAIEPDATKAYFDAISAPPADETAVLLAHHVLLLPNQSMWVLVPSMGGCDGAYGGAVSANFLCYWRFPRSVSLGALGPISPGVPLPSPQPGFGSAPPVYFLFLLVPLASVFVGGRRAAARGSPATPGEAGLLGLLSGAVFALLVGLASYMASIQISYAASFGGAGVGSAIRVGPNILTGSLLALAWGGIGGYLGGRIEARSLPLSAPAAPAAPAAPTAPTEAWPPPPAP